MKYKKQILASIDGAKDALDAGFLSLCYEYTELARDWLDLEKEWQELHGENKPLDEATAKILSFFDHPMYHKKEAE